VLRVGLVGSRRICAAQVECLVDPGGSRRNPSDRPDDQGASETKSDGTRVVAAPVSDHRGLVVELDIAAS
jgi:hypothetical protein